MSYSMRARKIEEEQTVRLSYCELAVRWVGGWVGRWGLGGWVGD